MNTPTIFLDLDGVLADFDRHVIDSFKQHPAVLDLEEKLWTSVSSAGWQFWRKMPPTPWFKPLIATVSTTNWPLVILTGLPSTDREEARLGKRAWVDTYLSPLVPMIGCASRDKFRHIRKPGDLLIDDRPDNLRSWLQAGGKGVLWLYHHEHDSFSRLDKVLDSMAEEVLA